ncbi:MAG: hypothetical protein ACKORL_12025 [Phycisphaerales bacterium]
MSAGGGTGSSAAPEADTMKRAGFRSPDVASLPNVKMPHSPVDGRRMPKLLSDRPIDGSFTTRQPLMAFAASGPENRTPTQNAP